MNNCENCANKSIPRSAVCDVCTAKYFNGAMVSQPTHWREKKPMTNADRIRAMTDEELAEWLARTQIEAIKDAMTILRLPYDESDEIVEMGKAETLEWLQQPAEGDA